MNDPVLDRYAPALRQFAKDTEKASRQHEKYFGTRKVRPERNFLIACRHWNSSTPILPVCRTDLLPYPQAAGYGFGGGYFLVANGMGIAVDPGYGFVQVLYQAYGYTICDIDVVFITHDHPDHWADLANILVLKHMASRYANSPSRKPEVYLGPAVAGLYTFLSPVGSATSTIRPGQIVHLSTPCHVKVAKVTALEAFHCERLCADTNSPHVVGLHFEIQQSRHSKLGMRNIAIPGDTQFPSMAKLKAGLHEFVEEDVHVFESQYDSGPCGGTAQECPRGDREIDVLALHIGSVEADIARIPDTGASRFVKEEVFYRGYHLGFAGCLKMLDMVFRNDQAGKVAILTEFGEELRGRRVDLARILQRATEANPGQSLNVRVLPADIGMALELTWDRPNGQSAANAKQGAKLRCNKCLRMKEARCPPDEDFDLMDPQLFHPIPEMDIFEDLDTGLIQYCCRA